MILFSSSNLALSSTKTVTCLPLSAAFASALIIGEFPLTLYKVCFIARTFLSAAAFETKSITGSKLSYGCESKISFFFISSNISSQSISLWFITGTCFLSFSLSKPSREYIFIRTVRSRGPFILNISSSSTFSSLFRKFKRLASILSSASSLIASPHCLFLSFFFISSNRSDASSSSSLNSAFLITLNVAADITS